MDRFLDKINKFVPMKWRWVLDHSGFRRYFKNTGWMFFGQMFSLLVSFFIGAWLARYLGPETYGVFNYAMAFSGLFGFISDLGINSILNRELIKFPEKRDELLGTSFYLKIVGGLIALLLSILSVLLFQTNPLIKLLVILFSFSFVLQSVNVIVIYFQSEVKSKNNVKAVLVATIISSLLKISVILLGYGIIWIVVIYVLDSFWQGLGFLRAYKKCGLKIKKWHFNKGLACEILKNSWPLMLASAAGAIYLKIDQVIIGTLLGTREVGLYAAAVKLVEIWYFLPLIISSSLFPAIINAKKTSPELYKSRLKNFYILMTIIPILIAVPISIFAKPIIYILFGSGYLESVNILQIYVWSSLGLFLSWAIGQYLTSENLVKTIFWLNCLAMIVNIILNFTLIPILGLSGAAWATLISYLVVPLVIFIRSKMLKII